MTRRWVRQTVGGPEPRGVRITSGIAIRRAPHSHRIEQTQPTAGRARDQSPRPPGLRSRALPYGEVGRSDGALSENRARGPLSPLPEVAGLKRTGVTRCASHAPIGSCARSALPLRPGLKEKHLLSKWRSACESFQTLLRSSFVYLTWGKASAATRTGCDARCHGRPVIVDNACSYGCGGGSVELQD